VVSAFQSAAAESKAIRLAVGPFFAPVSEEGLRQASQAMPELLMAELSHQARFQLVEREKVEAIWNEMKLTSSNLVARDTVTKLGHVLACDWLLSGSFVRAGGRTHVWTKVIDIRSGVLLDLNDSPFDPADYGRAVAGIAAFVGNAGSQSKGRQFIALGPFVDMTVPAGVRREDWSRRIAALIERHGHEAGYGVVELAAIGPIFEERRLESAGLTGNPEGRVKLEAAFWLVDGGCGWLEGEPPKLGVGLRVQRIGGPEQIVHFTNAPGASTEKAVLAALSDALAKTNLLAQAGPNAEADLLNTRGMEQATRRSPFSAPMLASTVARGQGAPRETPGEVDQRAQEQQQRRLEGREAIAANYERLLLRDPDNQEAKRMLAYTWLASADRAKNARAMEMMREVEANKKDPVAADRAHRLLTNAPLLKMIAEYSTHTPERPPPRPRHSTVVDPAQPDLRSEPEENEATAARREFLQQHFSKFMPARFEKDGPRMALLQTLSVKGNTFDYQGRHYCGFRFTLPPVLDGDFKWMGLLANRSAPKGLGTYKYEWYIIPKTGKMNGFTGFGEAPVASCAELRQRFPYTQDFFYQSLPLRCLRPGQEYAIWFATEDDDLPDIAFALTIQGRSEFGSLPMQ
jgi:TolB-like protein